MGSPLRLLTSKKPPSRDSIWKPRRGHWQLSSSPALQLSSYLVCLRRHLQNRGSVSVFSFDGGYGAPRLQFSRFGGSLLARLHNAHHLSTRVHRARKKPTAVNPRACREIDVNVHQAQLLQGEFVPLFHHHAASLEYGTIQPSERALEADEGT